jgi:hypothetical protein
MRPGQYHSIFYSNIVIIKSIIKINNIGFFLNGSTDKPKNWIKVEQHFKKIYFKLTKILNRVARKTLNKSLHNSINFITNGITFFTKPKFKLKPIIKTIILNEIEPLTFVLLCVKLNNKIYVVSHLKIAGSFTYSENTFLFSKFNNHNL